MKIGLDFDGVISDCGKLKSIYAKKNYGVDIPAQRFKMELIVGDSPGQLTQIQYREMQSVIHETREIGLLMEPVEGALRYIPKLIADGHRVGVISSRSNKGLLVAQEWSIIKGLDLSFVSTRHNVNKVEATTGLDVYMDDDLNKLVPLVGVVPHRFLFSQKYNIQIETWEIAQRINSWEDFYNTIRKIR